MNETAIAEYEQQRNSMLLREPPESTGLSTYGEVLPTLWADDLEFPVGRHEAVVREVGYGIREDQPRGLLFEVRFTVGGKVSRPWKLHLSKRLKVVGHLREGDQIVVTVEDPMGDVVITHFEG